MPPLSYERHTKAHPGMSPGLDERQLNRETGLRSAFFDYTVGQGHPTLGTAVAAATSYTDFAGSIPISRQVLPAPVTPCIVIYRLIGTNSRVVKFRVRGYDQFGEQIEEVTPTITLAEPTWNTAGGSGVFFSTCYIWLSRVFSIITSVEFNATGLNVATIPDTFVVTTAMYHDRCRGQAVIWNDATGGTFTMSITPPGGAPQTTGAIAHNASAATVKAAIEALVQFSTPGRTVDVEGGGKMVLPNGNPWVISFNGGGPRDQFDITTDDTLLTGGSVGSTITGPEYVGHDNLGIGSPLRLNSYAPAVGQQTSPDMVYMTVGTPEQDVLAAYTPIPITAITAATPPVVTLARGLPIELVGASQFLGFFVGTNSTPALAAHVCQRVGTPGSGKQNQIEVPGLTTSGTGNAGTLYVVRRLDPSAVQVRPAGAGLSSAGYRLGINDSVLSGWQGDPNKINLYLDESRQAGVHRLGFGFGGNRPLDVRNPAVGKVRYQGMVRTSLGTYRSPASGSSYPR